MMVINRLLSIAHFFNRDVATMSTAIRKLEKRVDEDAVFRDALAMLKINIKLLKPDPEYSIADAGGC